MYHDIPFNVLLCRLHYFNGVLKFCVKEKLLEWLWVSISFKMLHQMVGSSIGMCFFFWGVTLIWLCSGRLGRVKEKLFKRLYGEMLNFQSFYLRVAFKSLRSCGWKAIYQRLIEMKRNWITIETWSPRSSEYVTGDIFIFEGSVVGLTLYLENFESSGKFSLAH